MVMNGGWFMTLLYQHHRVYTCLNHDVPALVPHFQTPSAAAQGTDARSFGEISSQMGGITTNNRKW